MKRRNRWFGAPYRHDKTGVLIRRPASIYHLVRTVKEFGHPSNATASAAVHLESLAGEAADCARVTDLSVWRDGSARGEVLVGEGMWWELSGNQPARFGGPRHPIN